MPRASLKRAVSVRIGDFSNREQELLRAAFHAFIPMVLIGFMDDGPHVISLGHPDGLANAAASPDGSRIYSIHTDQGRREAAGRRLSPCPCGKGRTVMQWFASLPSTIAAGHSIILGLILCAAEDAEWINWGYEGALATVLPILAWALACWWATRV